MQADHEEACNAIKGDFEKTKLQRDALFAEVVSLRSKVKVGKMEKKF